MGEQKAADRRHPGGAGVTETKPPLLVTAHQDGHLRLWTMEVRRPVSYLEWPRVEKIRRIIK